MDEDPSIRAALLALADTPEPNGDRLLPLLAGAVVVHPKADRVCLVQAGDGEWRLPGGEIQKGGHDRLELSAIQSCAAQTGLALRFHGLAPNPLDLGRRAEPERFEVRFLLVAEEGSIARGPLARPLCWLPWREAAEAVQDRLEQRALKKAQRFCHSAALDRCHACGAMVDDGARAVPQGWRCRECDLTTVPGMHRGRGWWVAAGVVVGVAAAMTVGWRLGW